MGTIPTTYQEVLYWYPDVIRTLEEAHTKTTSPHRDTPLDKWKFSYDWGESIDGSSQEVLNLLYDRIEQRLNRVAVRVEAKPDDPKSRACLHASRPAWDSPACVSVQGHIVWDELPTPLIKWVVNDEISRATEKEIDSYFKIQTPTFVNSAYSPVVIVSREDQQQLDIELDLYPEPELQARLERHFDCEFGAWFDHFKIPVRLLVKRPGLAAHLALLYDKLYHCMWDYVQPKNILHAFKHREELREEDKDYDSYAIFPCIRATNFIIKRWLDLLPIGGAERELMEGYFRYYDGCVASHYLCYALLRPEIEAALEKRVRP